ncbi:hypothetical protein KY092_20330 [Natronomonas gomsonensis]|uniref:hypothetical protein n=1 Tax=Natronomonas gomsonensis TaxID=1046043 RepID=UPI00227C9225|nr:hypothetical protein [Natronomonas gomsonensis]MCY4732882.1 hypothetical protein [Natronomonas gomsonensis]
MSEQVPRSVFVLSLGAGICWTVRLLRRYIWHGIELFGGLERLVVGLSIAIVIEYFGEVLVAVLALRLFWMVRRDDRPFDRLEREIQLAILAGLAFLIATPFTSGLFYFLVPQPDPGPVAAALSIGRNVSVALLVGSLTVPRVISRCSSAP